LHSDRTGKKIYVQIVNHPAYFLEKYSAIV
jgi:hypothetical protein